MHQKYILVPVQPQINSHFLRAHPTVISLHLKLSKWRQLMKIVFTPVPGVQRARRPPLNPALQAIHFQNY